VSTATGDDRARRSRLRPLVIAHRGASATRPENTVEAFVEARVLGADWVELDARATADGLLVVHHDAHLADGRAIVDLGAAELPPSVATLDEALDACTGMGVNVEIKNDPDDPDHDPELVVASAVVARLVDRASSDGHGPDFLLVTSFDRAVVARAHALAPHVPVGQLVFDPGPDVGELLERVMGAGCAALNPWDPLVDTDLVAEAHGHGLAVNVWTVDDPARMAELVGFGVDGIITNVPDVARAVVDGG
jgi:glycerophosphoryl diester phosphodiesterase